LITLIFRCARLNASRGQAAPPYSIHIDVSTKIIATLWLFFRCGAPIIFVELSGNWEKGAEHRNI